MNVVGKATSCISFSQFGSNSRWFTGPNFLLNATLDGFSEKTISTKHIPETITEVNITNNNMMISDMNKFIFNFRFYYSDLDKMIKHLAWPNNYKLINHLDVKIKLAKPEKKKKHGANLKYITLSEIEESKLVIFRYA